MNWYRKLHWQIICALLLGIIYGVIAAKLGWTEFTGDWISPFGDIFLNLLKLIAVPLVFASLVTGVASLSNLKKLSRIGGKTIVIYIGTTVVASVIGLTVVNLIRPGDNFNQEMQQDLRDSFQSAGANRTDAAEEVKQRGPLQFLSDMIPSNLFESASNNRNMLQIVVIALLFGVALIKTRAEYAKPITIFFDGLTQVIIQLVYLIMKVAPIGVFALIAKAITEMAGDDPSRIFSFFKGLAMYMLVVILGLLIQSLVVYPVMLKLLFRVPISIRFFLSGIREAQLLAFSTSSSGATLPVTMRQCETRLGVSKEISSFVLPLGATVNMDGTALYQSVAAVFIAQAMGVDLSLGLQVTILLTAVLASIGTAAVPSAGVVMLMVILEAISGPELPLSEGIFLILGVDRILDMLRTTTNITGDAAVASIIAASEGELNPPDGGF